MDGIYLARMALSAAFGLLIGHLAVRLAMYHDDKVGAGLVALAGVVGIVAIFVAATVCK